MSKNDTKFPKAVIAIENTIVKIQSEIGNLSVQVDNLKEIARTTYSFSKDDLTPLMPDVAAASPPEAIHQAAPKPPRRRRGSAPAQEQPPADNTGESEETTDVPDQETTADPDPA